jgi:hypothetical protein
MRPLCALLASLTLAAPCARAEDPYMGSSSGEPGLLEYLALGVACAATATSPLWLPPLVAGDDFRAPGYFPAYPYADGHDGYMHLDRDAERIYEFQKAEKGDPGYLRTWALRASADHVFDLGGRVRENASVFLDTTSRFGGRFHWTGSIDPEFANVPAGQLDSWGFDATVRIAQSEWFQVHTGLGLGVLSGRDDADLGVNFFYGATCYPGRPVVVSAGVDATLLGSAFLVHARTSVGVMWRRFEAFAGWDYLWIDPTHRHGPLVGLRVWF